MKHPKLKHCPFCGEPGEYELGGYPTDPVRLVAARCLAGHATSPQFRTHDEAARWWNRRSPKRKP